MMWKRTLSLKLFNIVNQVTIAFPAPFLNDSFLILAHPDYLADLLRETGIYYALKVAVVVIRLRPLFGGILLLP